MADEAPDYFEPEGGAVLTHLLIVRDIDRPREFYRRVTVPSCLRRSTAVSCTHAGSGSPRLAASALICRDPRVAERGGDRYRSAS
jgi:hypothetical protein